MTATGHADAAPAAYITSFGLLEKVEGQLRAHLDAAWAGQLLARAEVAESIGLESPPHNLRVNCSRVVNFQRDIVQLIFKASADSTDGPYAGEPWEEPLASIQIMSVEQKTAVTAFKCSLGLLPLDRWHGFLLVVERASRLGATAAGLVEMAGPFFGFRAGGKDPGSRRPTGSIFGSHTPASGEPTTGNTPPPPRDDAADAEQALPNRDELSGLLASLGVKPVESSAEAPEAPAPPPEEPATASELDDLMSSMGISNQEAAEADAIVDQARAEHAAPEAAAPTSSPETTAEAETPGPADELNDLMASMGISGKDAPESPEKAPDTSEKPEPAGEASTHTESDLAEATEADPPGLDQPETSDTATAANEAAADDEPRASTSEEGNALGEDDNSPTSPPAG